MSQLDLRSFVIKRLLDNWKLLSSVFLGVLVVSTLVSGTPVYFGALQKIGLATAIDRTSASSLHIFTYAPHIPLSNKSVEKTGLFFDEALKGNIKDIYRGYERYIKTPTYLVGLPHRPLSLGLLENQRVSRGFIRSISNVDKHVEFLQGKMSTDTIIQETEYTILEGMVGIKASNTFKIGLGDEITLVRSLSELHSVKVKIVGIMDAIDPLGEFWQYNAATYLSPEPLDDIPEEGIVVDPREPPLAVFITENALINGLGTAYPETLVTSNWFVLVDKEGLKQWSTKESNDRITSLEAELTTGLPGSGMLTGIKGMNDNFKERSFFTGIPLLLLLAIMLMTLFYYLIMMASYMSSSRESDTALLKSRGLGLLELLKIYSLEGLIISTLAVVIAPFLASSTIALAGILPYFNTFTDGDTFPFRIYWVQFLLSASVGILCVGFYVAPSLIASRVNLLSQKMKSSRPNSTPLFQKLYLDIGILGLGGLVFWELYARGKFVSGGLFEEVQVNEVLLVAPVLFLFAVGLIFMRIFPLFVRYVSGDSPGLVNLIALTSLSLLLLAVISDKLDMNESDLTWAISICLILFISLTYSVYRKSRNNSLRVLFLITLISTITMFTIWEWPLDKGTLGNFPYIVLLILVPAELTFLFLRRISALSPIWLSMGLWHMSRNPFQYSWIVLLLVLVTGMGILSTTVGGTLNRSYDERILYDVGSDIRVTKMLMHRSRDITKINKQFEDIPGVKSVSFGLRSEGSLSSHSAGSFELLALQPEKFKGMSWYRDDFSEKDLSGVMDTLKPPNFKGPIPIPDDAISIGLWIKPKEVYPKFYLWLVIEDAHGSVKTLTLGNPGKPEWHFQDHEIPANLVRPLTLVSVQVFEPAFGPGGTSGEILLDNIQVKTGDKNDAFILEDFESSLDWIPLATSPLAKDNLSTSNADVYAGAFSGLFVFGKDTDRGIRGFYRSSTGGPVPVVSSLPLLRSAGININDSLIINVFGKLIPVIIVDYVYNFPTMDGPGNKFLLVDIDNLLRHINILSPTSKVYPNEMFIKEVGTPDYSVYESIAQEIGSFSRIKDRQSQLRAIDLDPLITMGWKALMIVSLGIVIFSAGLGYVTYILLVSKYSRREVGILRSLGLSHLQMVGVISFEHVVIVLIGISMGTWAGYQMSNLLVSAVAVTDRGDPVIPSFIISTNWSFMVPVFIVMIAFFIISMYFLIRSMFNKDLQTISRWDGY